MSPVFKIASRSLRKNWRQSLACMLSIAVGFVAVCLFRGLVSDLQATFEEGLRSRAMYGHILIEKAGAWEHAREDAAAFKLSADEQATLDALLQARDPEIDATVRFLILQGLINNGRTNTVFVGMGYDVEPGAKIRGETWAWNTLAGTPLHVTGASNPVVLAKSLGILLNCEGQAGGDVFRPGGGLNPVERPFTCFRDTVQMQTMTDTGQLNALNVKVVGLVDSGLRELDDRFLSLPLPVARQLAGSDAVNMYSVALRDPAQVPAFMEALRADARVKGLELDVVRWQDHPIYGETYRRYIGFMEVFTRFMLWVVALIGAMSVVNTLAKSVAERTREIGTLRSMGYLRRHIGLMFASEGLLMAAVACGVGLVATLGLTALINGMGLHYPSGFSTTPVLVNIRVSPRVFVVVTVILCVISVLASLLPARRGAKMRITDALGHI